MGGGGGCAAREGEAGGMGAGLDGTGGRSDGGVAGVGSSSASAEGVAGAGCCCSFFAAFCLARRSWGDIHGDDRGNRGC